MEIVKMLKVETLITTMRLTDPSALLSRMNVKHNYIIGNQCDKNEVQKTENGIIVSTDMRGVGQNRNNIIERSNADICVLADDDIVFCDEYESLVASAFENNPKADVLIFNFINESQGRRVNGKTKRIRYHNYMNYGAARIAFRRRPIVYHSIFFNTMFGGGTPHQCGEDTLFLNSCLKAGLKVYAVPVALASLTYDRESTWFKGFNEKYFFDKGVVLGLAHPKLGKLLALLLILKHRQYKGVMPLSKCLKITSDGFKYIDSHGEE